MVILPLAVGSAEALASRVMKTSPIAVAVLALFAASAAFAQHDAHSTNPPARPRPPVGDYGLGMFHHPVSTARADAQKMFDQGLALCYGFNHDEAVRSFERAAQLDPELAMAQWGIALALGPNINMPMTPENGRRAWDALQRARALLSHASEPERGYIEALSARYGKDPEADRAKRDSAYADAMRKLSTRYPDDLDAATLLGEALMDLRPWQFWNRDGSPAPGTTEIITVFESVMKRDPDHLGANHYYIHTVEASPKPERGRGAAESLRALAPNTGHLMHMPSHIDARLGDFERVAKQNERAASIDRAFVTTQRPEGMYPLMYYSHNMHFAAYGHAMIGHYGDAMKYARELSREVAPNVAAVPMLEMFTPTQTIVQVMFGRWDELVRAPEPAASWVVTHAFWRFGRGMAFAGQGNLDAAGVELESLRSESKRVPADAIFGLNTAGSVLEIADRMLDAKVLEARGQTSKAIAALETAVTLEDHLAYDEPPDWYLHARVPLGGVLLRSGDPAKAEKVFRAALAQQPRLGRALFGLAETLEARGRSYDAGLIRRQFEDAWSPTSVTLAIADL